MNTYNQLFRNIIFVFSILTLGCSTQDSMVKDQIIESEMTDDHVSFLALGDSYTIGEVVSESARWPNQLSVLLEANDIEIDQTRIIAQTGWTTADLINAIESADVSDLKNEKLISLLIGVNNQFQNLDFDSFKEEFDQLLDISIGFGGEANRVFVVSIPDYGVTPFGSNNAEQIGQELDNYNAYMSNKCASRNIPFIDITQISRDLSDAPNSLAPDNLHPSGFQYGKWADKILPVALELFSK